MTSQKLYLNMVSSTDSKGSTQPEFSAQVQAEGNSPESAADQNMQRQQPIPLPSEPMQYRAIGLVRGCYEASDDQFTRGNLVAEDGTRINAVLLGRITSLVKKHLAPDESHLWVVYPRTREHKKDLHVQIVGVWEPEKLNRAETEDLADSDGEAKEGKVEPSDSEAEMVEESDSTVALSGSGAEESPEADYFSVRGEVVYYSAEEGKVIVKILQAARRQDDQDKSFKLTLKGILTGKTIGYFWDLSVKRQEEQLVIQSGQPIAIVPPKKKSSQQPRGERRGPSSGRPRSNRRPHSASDSKPIIKRKSVGAKEE